MMKEYEALLRDGRILRSEKLESSFDFFYSNIFRYVQFSHFKKEKDLAQQVLVVRILQGRKFCPGPLRQFFFLTDGATESY
jgi:hypothetical protein